MSWLSALIRLFARIRYNHTGVIVNNWSIPFVNEAVGRGIISIEAKERMAGKQVKIFRRKNPIIERDFAIRANSKLGKTPYDFSGLLFYQLAFQLFHVWIGTKNKERAEKKMYCYEYIAWLHSDIFSDWWKINPKDIEKNEYLECIFEGKFPS
jgi:hypothetical protein